MRQYTVLVPAAGVGSRMGAATPKQYLSVLQRPLMWHTLVSLNAVPEVKNIVLVISPSDEWFDTFEWDFTKLTVLREGGDSRAQTVKNGLKALDLTFQDWVLVHDAARCCIRTELVSHLIQVLSESEVGGLLALPVADTVKQSQAGNSVKKTIPRDGLWLAQTPQLFHGTTLLQALEQAPLAQITDEASAMEAMGLMPQLVEGEMQNFKITYPQDLPLANWILSNRYDEKG